MAKRDKEMSNEAAASMPQKTGRKPASAEAELNEEQLKKVAAGSLNFTHGAGGGGGAG